VDIERGQQRSIGLAGAVGGDPGYPSSRDGGSRLESSIGSLMTLDPKTITVEGKQP
jgi:hypothetical protein